MQATARLIGQTTGAALVALVFGVLAARGPLVTLMIAAVIAGAAAGVSFLRVVERGGRTIG